MNFLFELFEVQLNEQRTTYHESNILNGKKYKTLNLVGFVFNLMSFLVHQIATTP